MSINKIIYILTVFFFVETLSAANVQQEKVINKQEEILLELADFGVEESYHVLARFYADRISKNNDYLKKSIQWHVKSARLGNVKSLYRLGQYALDFQQYQKEFSGTYIRQDEVEKNWRKESLVFISLAAILGDSYAKSDLIMLPKLFSITNDDINDGMNEALLRLNQDQLINCDFIVCEKQSISSIDKSLKYRNASLSFSQKHKKSNCHSLILCIEKNLSDIKFVSKEKIDQFRFDENQDNHPKTLKNKRLENEANAELNDNWDEKSDKDRNNQRLLAAKKIIDHYTDEDRSKFKNRLSELLEKINYHRAPINKIELSEIMSILSKP